MKRIIFLVMMGMIMVMSMTKPVFACSVCYGTSDSPLMSGLNFAIFCMLIFLVVVLGSFAKFFLNFRKRAQLMNHQSS